MINYNSEILPYKGLGNFEIGANINKYLTDLYSENYSVDIMLYNESKRNEVHIYTINNNIKISTLSDGAIIYISSNNYNGVLNGSIKLGIKVSELKKVTIRQNINHGCLFLNGNFGFCFILPSPYDEIADTVDNLPNDLNLNEISVGDYDWWYKPELTPEYAKG